MVETLYHIHIHKAASSPHYNAQGCFLSSTYFFLSVFFFSYTRKRYKSFNGVYWVWEENARYLRLIKMIRFNMNHSKSILFSAISRLGGKVQQILVVNISNIICNYLLDLKELWLLTVMVETNQKSSNTASDIALKFNHKFFSQKLSRNCAKINSKSKWVQTDSGLTNWFSLRNFIIPTVGALK